MESRVKRISGVKMRRTLDQYYTPSVAVNAFLDSIDFKLSGNVLEPFSGEGAISDALFERGFKVFTNDLDPNNKANHRLDLAIALNWNKLPPANWIITNPPFNLAPQVIPLAFNHCQSGLIVLLRLSYLEPCRNRVRFLQEYPPTQLWVTPRISFTGKGTDSITTAWFVWDKTNNLPNKITIL